MLKVAILDDYQNVSQQFVDLEKLAGKYEIKIFSEPFEDEADALDKLAEFEALLIMRERTPVTKNLIENLTKLKFKENKMSILSLVIIARIPHTEMISPKIWYLLVCSTLNKKQSKIIIAGIAVLKRDALMTWVWIKDK